LNPDSKDKRIFRISALPEADIRSAEMDPLGAIFAKSSIGGAVRGFNFKPQRTQRDTEAKFSVELCALCG